MASTYITKAQRKILIDSYLDCAEEIGDDTTGTRERLQLLKNPDLINECTAFMPDCMEEL